MAQPDVLIVGGGVIGASIAYHLAEAGTRVMVLERGRAGGHASLASAGLLHPILSAGAAHPVRDLSLASFALFPNLVARLHEITGIDPEYQVPGFLMVALREDEVELHAAELSDPLAETYGLRLLSGDEARALEPGLSPRVAAAVHKPRGAQVYAPSLLQAYTHAAARLGATVRRGVEVTDLCVAPGRVTGARTADGEEITAGHTVIAGGAWTKHTAARLGVTLPVYPMRGQILALHAIPAPLRHIVFGADVYLAPKVEGSLIVGATYEEVGFDDRLTAAGVGWLLGAAQTMVPSLADATFRQAWVGLRPASPDHLPLLGPVPGWAGVTIATGHTAEGVLLSAITGKIIAQHARGEPTDLPLEPFSPARFGR
jgi:glycine oxidase